MKNLNDYANQIVKHLYPIGVFVPEAGRELEENDALISVQNVADVQESGRYDTFVQVTLLVQ